MQLRYTYFRKWMTVYSIPWCVCVCVCSYIQPTCMMMFTSNMQASFCSQCGSRWLVYKIRLLMYKQSWWLNSLKVVHLQGGRSYVHHRIIVHIHAWKQKITCSNQHNDHIWHTWNVVSDRWDFFDGFTQFSLSVITRDDVWWSSVNPHTSHMYYEQYSCRTQPAAYVPCKGPHLHRINGC